MPRTLLVTVGTSIAQGSIALKETLKRNTYWDEPLPVLEAQIRERLGRLDLHSEKGRVEASAETNILHRLRLSQDDTVVLFATDTAEGRVCAGIIAEALRQFFDCKNVKIERVEGLQVRDARKLRRTGLVKLVNRLLAYLNDDQLRYTAPCVLCPNGGYKGVMPFAAVVGMITRCRVAYVFEFAETVIDLPPLPFELDRELFDRVAPALVWAKEKDVFNPGAFFSRIPGFDPSEREVFEAFLEVVDDATNGSLASLSPLADLFTSAPGGRELPALRISALARAELEALSGPDLKEVLGHLDKLRVPLWRARHLDTKHDSDLHFFPKGHNPWRFAGFERDGVFHLCWFARHDQYERDLSAPNRQRRAFEAENFKLFDREKFGNKEDRAGVKPGFSETFVDLVEEREKLRGQINDLTAEVELLREDIRRYQSLVETARSREVEAETGASPERVMTRPWWKKLLGIR